MKLFFCGDIVGRSGREAALSHLPRLKAEHAFDFVVASGDNAAGGFGITSAVARELLAGGVDVITGGDHIWDQKEILPYLAQEKRLLRPANFPDSAPGAGSGLFEAVSGRKVFVVHLLGQVFHKEHAACPFATANQLLEGVRMPAGAQAILVDFHAEATSEKMAMGHHLDGRVSLVVGSHTHVPTADARILPRGTAYQTDAGMCGDYNSVIGFAPEGPLQRFLTKISRVPLEPASGEGTLCGVMVETDDTTGLAKAVTAIRRGGVLC